MKYLTILAAIILAGCTSSQQTAQRWADSKYNRCVDAVHAKAKDGERIVWRLDIDACMGSKGDEYQQYQYAKDTKLPPRWSVEVTP